MESMDVANNGVMLVLNMFGLQQSVTQRFLELVTLYLIAVDGYINGKRPQVLF